MKVKCDICGLRSAHEKIITEKFKYKGEIIEVPNYRIIYCDNCNEAIVPLETIKKTEPILREWQKEINERIIND